MASSQTELREMVEELCQLEEGLNEWEVEFVESMSKWRGDFTPKQAAKIEKIYEEN